MGANFNSMTLDGKLTAEQVTNKFQEVRENDRNEYGADSYNGSFSTLRRVTVCDRVFENLNEAEDYCETHSNKWDNAVAVKARNITKKLVKKPTFNGKDPYVGGAPVHIAYSSKDFVAADQLTDNQKAKLKKLFCDWEGLRDTCGTAKQYFNGLVHQLNDANADFKDYTSLRRARAAYVVAYKVVVKAKKAFDELEERFRDKLYKSKEIDNGLIWVLGGWCAE